MRVQEYGRASINATTTSDGDSASTHYSIVLFRIFILESCVARHSRSPSGLLPTTFGIVRTTPPAHSTTMAKSLRAKAKMAGRRKKREQGNYHAADAARVARISAKLLGKQPKAEGEEDEEVMEGEEEEVVEDDAEMSASAMVEVD